MATAAKIPMPAQRWGRVSDAGPVLSLYRATDCCDRLCGVNDTWQQSLPVIYKCDQVRSPGFGGGGEDDDEGAAGRVSERVLLARVNNLMTLDMLRNLKICY